MKQFAFLISMVVLPIQIESSPLGWRNVRPIRTVNRENQNSNTKIPCGPVRFPDISCEEVTTGITVTNKDITDEVKNEDDEPLHKRYERQIKRTIKSLNIFFVFLPAEGDWISLGLENSCLSVQTNNLTLESLWIRVSVYVIHKQWERCNIRL